MPEIAICSDIADGKSLMLAAEDRTPKLVPVAASLGIHAAVLVSVLLYAAPVVQPPRPAAVTVTIDTLSTTVAPGAEVPPAAVSTNIPAPASTPEVAPASLEEQAATAPPAELPPAAAASSAEVVDATAPPDAKIPAASNVTEAAVPASTSEPAPSGAPSDAEPAASPTAVPVREAATSTPLEEEHPVEAATAADDAVPALREAMPAAPLDASPIIAAAPPSDIAAAPAEFAAKPTDARPFAPSVIAAAPPADGGVPAQAAASSTLPAADPAALVAASAAPAVATAEAAIPSAPATIPAAQLDDPSFSAPSHVATLEAGPSIAAADAFVHDYDGGTCFFAAVVHTSTNGTAIDILADRKPKFQALNDAFRATFGLDPNVLGQRVTPAQCAAVDLLRRSRSEQTRVLVDRNRLGSGDTLTGMVETALAGSTTLYLVDETGQITDVTHDMRAEGARNPFAIPVGHVGRPGSASRLLLAVTAQDPGTIPRLAFDGSFDASHFAMDGKLVVVSDQPGH